MAPTQNSPEQQHTFPDPLVEKRFDQLAQWQELNDMLDDIETWESGMHGSENAQKWQEVINARVQAINEDIAANRDEVYGKIEALIETVKPLSEWIRSQGIDLYDTRGSMDIERGDNENVNTYTLTLPYVRYRCGMRIDESQLKGCTYRFMEWTKEGARYTVTIPDDSRVPVTVVNRDGTQQRVILTAGTDMEIAGLTHIRSKWAQETVPAEQETVVAQEQAVPPQEAEPSAEEIARQDGEIVDRNTRKAYAKLAGIFGIPITESDNLPSIAEHVIKRLSDSDWYSTADTGLYIHEGQLWESDSTFLGTDEQVDFGRVLVADNFAELVRSDPAKALSLLANGTWEKKLEDPRIAGTKKKSVDAHASYRAEREFTSTETLGLTNALQQALEDLHNSMVEGKSNANALGRANEYVRDLMRVPDAAARIQGIVDAVSPVTSADGTTETKVVFRPDWREVMVVGEPLPGNPTRLDVAGGQ